MSISSVTVIRTAHNELHDTLSNFQHDANILTLGKFLQINVIDNLLPDYASYLAIELHKLYGSYFVEVRIRGSLVSL